jgi:magnesium chelatase family protein
MTKNIARVYAAELEGVEARPIEVEVDINIGLHAFTIVGLADKALNEAKERVNAALKNSNIKPPNQENRRITVNLAPADVKKTGSQYDLAIAVGYLLATNQIAPFYTKDKIFVGELALDGNLRSVSGGLNIAQMAQKLGFAQIFISKMNANEAAAINGIDVIPIQNLGEVIEILEGRKIVSPAAFKPEVDSKRQAPDFSEIKGQENTKRALMIAAAGGHNLIMIGPPGVGKSFLAQALCGVLPDLSREEAIEITKIWSAAGLGLHGLVWHRPFRAPHQTASVAALVGGGQDPKPGEISLAHGGVLFMDELPEFQRGALEALRQPMESGIVHVARAKKTLVFPARFALVAAMNPCPCGYYGDSERECKCSPYEVIKYQKKISGPLLDRIDIQVKVAKVKIEELQKEDPGGFTSPNIKKKIELARRIQRERLARFSITTNAETSSREIEQLVNFGPSAVMFLKTLNKSGLSPRAYYRILKVARTIADLEESAAVDSGHLAEAYSYRLRDENI